MKDYYKILKIDNNVSEERLDGILINLEYRYDMVIKNSVSEEYVSEAKKYKKLIKDFRDILNSYGSKEKYDRALKLTYKVIGFKKKIKVNKERFKNLDKSEKFKLVVGMIVAGSITVGVSIAAINLEKTEIPVFDDDSVSKVLEDYDIETYQLLGKSLVGMGEKYTDSGVEIIHWKNDKEKIDEISDERKQEHYTPIYYFYYVVKSGDTEFDLCTKFKTNSIETKGSLMFPGDVVTVYTEDEEVYRQGKLQYEIDTQEPILVEFEPYVIKEGDTIVSIAKQFDNVTVQDILDYNNNIEDIKTIIAGSTIKIPTKILYGKEAYEYEKQKEALENQEVEEKKHSNIR